MPSGTGKVALANMDSWWASIHCTMAEADEHHESGGEEGGQEDHGASSQPSTKYVRVPSSCCMLSGATRRQGAP